MRSEHTKNHPRRITSLRRCLHFTSRSGDQWLALEVGSAQPLAIPRTKQAAASPFHCRLVSSGSKKANLRALRTMLTNGVSPKFEKRSVIAVTGVSFLSASRLPSNTNRA
jgi:hypothetical protein